MVLVAMPKDSLKVRSLLALTTHLSDHVDSPSDLGLTVSLMICMGLLLEPDKFSSLTLWFHCIDWDAWLKPQSCLKTVYSLASFNFVSVFTISLYLTENFH